MKLLVGISADDNPFVDSRRRPRERSYLEGVVPLHGLSLAIGANSSGKTAMLENIEQALARGWRPRSDRRLYRPQRAKRQLLLELDLNPGSSDLSWLESLKVGDGVHEDLTLTRFAKRRNLSLTAAIATIAESLLESELDFHRDGDDEDDEPSWWLEEPVPSSEELEEVARRGRFALEMYRDAAYLSLDPSAFGGPASVLMPLCTFAALDQAQREAILPPVVSASAEATDVSAVAETCIAVLTESWFGISLDKTIEDPTDLPPRHPWITQDEFDKPQLALGARATAGVLQTAVTRLLPPFVGTEGSFRLQVLEPERWATGRSVVAGFSEGRNFRRAETSGSGTRRWLALCLELATATLGHRQLKDDPDERGRSLGETTLRTYWRNGFGLHDLQPSRRAQPLLLFDEPELHLHPLAQREAGQWLSQRLLEGDLGAVVAATHSPTMLGATSSSTRVLALRREDGRTPITQLSGDLLAELDALSTAAGLGREAWLFVTRAVLVVEGRHDQQILEVFYKRQLGRLRCRTLVLDGTKNSNRLLDSEFVGESGLPMYVLFDNVRLDRIRAGMSLDEMTDEEQRVSKLLSKSQEHDLVFLPYSEPDILCALPRVTVARRYGRQAFDKLTGSDDYWGGEIAKWRDEVESGQRKSFKRWIAEDRLGLARQTDLVTELLTALQPDDEASPELRQAVEELEVQLSMRDLGVL
jgi:hypothetical protein